MDPVAQSQLNAIAEVLDIARNSGAQLWLRGGWAVDFTAGRVTRAHLDIDWFGLVDEIDTLSVALQRHGWDEVTWADSEQQRDFVRDHIEIGIALIRIDRGEPLVAGGPFADEPWPLNMIQGSRTRELQGIAAQVIEPLSQIEIKTMMPEWNPRLQRRAKDLDDIELLRRTLNQDA